MTRAIGIDQRPRHQQSLRGPITTIVLWILRLIGVVLFGYAAIGFLVSGVDWLGPFASPGHGPYLSSVVLAAVGVALSLAFGDRQLRARTILRSAAWLLIGAVVLVLWVSIAVLTVLAPAAAV